MFLEKKSLSQDSHNNPKTNLQQEEHNRSPSEYHKA